jgi:HEAT repeat protein
VQYQARDALAQRMTRMKTTTLRDRLQDDNVDVRRAAALACGRKKEVEHIPELLQLLDDPEPPVIQAARKALKELTGEDFGPDEEAGTRGGRLAKVVEGTPGRLERTTLQVRSRPASVPRGPPVLKSDNLTGSAAVR